MTMNVADFLLQRLSDWDIQRIYGYPGDGINGIMGAMDRAGERFTLVRARHEEMCAFMACAHAKFTGQLGVCLATSGPGAIHLLNGLYDAKLDHQPVLAIVGQAPRATLGGQYQQEVDLLSLAAMLVRRSFAIARIYAETWLLLAGMGVAAMVWAGMHRARR